MQPSRRRLLWFTSAAAAGCFFNFASGRAQDAGSSGRGRRPADSPEDPSDSPNSPNPNFNPAKTRLEEHQKNIKKEVEKLYNLASQLKTEVEKTDSTTVLSLAMVKKAEEIEKLAKQIKDHAKG
jgi:hypothetical protein